MPPRSKKAARKKPSPRTKKPSPKAKKTEDENTAAGPEETLPVVPEEKDIVVAEDPASISEVEEKVVEVDVKVVNEDAVPATAVKEEGNAEDDGDNAPVQEEVMPSAAEEANVMEIVENEEEGDLAVPPEKIDETKALSLEPAKDVNSPEALGEVNECNPSEIEGSSSEAVEVPGDVKESNDGPSEMQTEEAEIGTVADKEEDTKECGTEVAGHVQDGDVMGNGDQSGPDDDASDEEDEEADPSIYFQAPLTERRKQKEFEIFVGGLDKKATEEDLTKVFGAFGEIQSVRVVKNPMTKKSKGFAFIRYTNVEHARKALAELKDGAEVRGRRVGVSVSMDNDTLYLGNICKTWTKSQVLETLTGFGLEHIEEILLPDDPNNEGKIKGFAFLVFNSHSDAITAFQRLKKPDAIFGANRSAKVAFTQSSVHLSEEVLSQIKTVYVDGLPSSWDEEKVKDLCKQYGEIEKVRLSRNFSKKRRKNFGFIDFISRECALACVEGINNTHIGEGEVKVSANFARPQNNGRLAKRGARGGFLLKKDGEAADEVVQSNTNSQSNSKVEVQDKGKTLENSEITEGNKPSESHGNISRDKKGAVDHLKQPQSSRGRKREGKHMSSAKGRPSKKGRKVRSFGYTSGRHPGYALPVPSYQSHAYSGPSGSTHNYSDLEPHAGYLPARNQDGHPYGYVQTRAAGYDNQPRSNTAYARAGLGLQSSYHAYSSYAGYPAGYYPGPGSYTHQRPYY